MNVTSFLFRAARLSADARAVSKGPKATGKRLVRKAVGRAWGRTGIPRWPATLAVLALVAVPVAGAHNFGTNGTDSPDTLWGHEHADWMYGYGGRDTFYAYEGPDSAWGGDGNDYMKMGRGEDWADGQRGNDQILGGYGDDTLHARDGEHDYVDGGPGWDYCRLDRIDSHKNCEVRVYP